MSNLLKGNFEVAKNVQPQSDSEEDLEQRFEREAMKKLGGSIAFVAKKKIKWKKDQE